ncbi:MAG: pentapeptide repeat-containing protein, partial [Rhodoluna sp.]
MAQQITITFPSKLKRMLALISSALLISGIFVVGNSDVSSAASLATPGRVKGVVVTPGNESVAVSWVAPSYVGTSPINSYAVASEDGLFTCSTTGATSCTVTGLTNGTGYRFVVTAANSSGNSTPSSASKLVTPLTVSSAPQSVSTIAGIKAVKVSWAAPSSNGGSAIKSYLVTSSPENKTCKSNLLPTCTVRGLTAGVNYVFSVTATNKAGSSPLAFSNEVSPLSAPSAPTTVTSSRQSGLIRVSWGAPQSDGGSAILSYRVTSTPSGYNCTTTSTSCSFTAINNGSSYTFSVVASNAIGRSAVGRSDGSISSSVVAHPPTNVQARAEEHAATVSWNAPVVNGGSGISNYTVTSSPGGFTCTTFDTLCLVTGLDNYRNYTFTVTATNSAGTSSNSAASASVMPGSRTVNGYVLYPGANLASTNLQGANLIGANLAGINLAGANLTGASLQGTNLTGANLAGANLTDAVVADANLIGANLIGANLIRTLITGVNLSGTNLSFTNLSGTDLSGTNLTGTNLTGSNLTSVNLHNSILTGTNLSGADLRNVRSGQIQGTPLGLPPLWVIEKGYLVGPEANLAWANLRNVNLAGANLTKINLSNAELTDANLEGSNLGEANLEGTNFRNALMSEAIITNAYLGWAVLINADLSEANLEGSNLF